ncbi:hypothetical protein UFOVP204_165 [uncultured Caudovirales phage]|uniref:Uncharacterized protein n=1 Tax=uncultured Caudovirales phage TaxID=2100421 RepID=A0A6J7WSL3_9CAUD|nr:hypothetical protein UFOVP204_165 [uncultured Caudovirales phage]
MKIQILSQYYKLGQAGKVKILACPNHVDEPGLTYDLFHSLEKEDIIKLKCLACNYEQTVGIQLYENILNKIKEFENEF